MINILYEASWWTGEFIDFSTLESPKQFYIPNKIFGRFHTSLLPVNITMLLLGKTEFIKAVYFKNWLQHHTAGNKEKAI